jgi:hypothetical protein
MKSFIKTNRLTPHIHIEPRRGTSKKFKNEGKCLLYFFKINLSD